MLYSSLLSYIFSLERLYYISVARSYMMLAQLIASKYKGKKLTGKESYGQKSEQD